MNVINFSAPDYSGISRRRDNAISGMGNALTGLENTLMQGARDYMASEQQKQQWDNLLEQQKYQRGRDTLMDERYNAEQKRQEDTLNARNKAMMQNRQAFMGSYGMGGTQPASQNSSTSDQDMFAGLKNPYGDITRVENDGVVGYNFKDAQGRDQYTTEENIRNNPNLFRDEYGFQFGNQQEVAPGKIDYSRFEQYGPAAVMAAQMFYNAPDYETQQQALQNLNSAIAMAEQKSEMDRAKLGSNLSTRVGSYLASQGLRNPQTLQGLTKKQIQDEQYISELEGYLGALSNLPEYAQNAETIQMMTELNSIIDSMRKKMNWTPRKNPSYGR